MTPVQSIGEKAHAQLREELEILDAAGLPNYQEFFLSGEQTPVFFGSAMNDFGVEPFLKQ